MERIELRKKKIETKMPVKYNIIVITLWAYAKSWKTLHTIIHISWIQWITFAFRHRVRNILEFDVLWLQLEIHHWNIFFFSSLFFFTRWVQSHPKQWYCKFYPILTRCTLIPEKRSKKNQIKNLCKRFDSIITKQIKMKKKKKINKIKILRKRSSSSS